MQTPARGNGPWAWLAALAVIGSGLGVLAYQALQSRQPPVSDASGFDLADVSESARQAAVAPRQQAQASGLGMITGAVPGMKTGQAVASRPATPAARFSELTRASEQRVEAMAWRYSKRFPVIQQYGRDWMGYPDLKKLNDDYMKNRDPIAFMKGVAMSPNFGKLIRKYATQKPIQDFVIEGVKTAPPGAVSTAMDYINTEKNLKGLVDNVAGNLGIPAGVMSMASGDPSKIDEKQVMQQVLGSNPELQRQLQNADLRR